MHTFLCSFVRQTLTLYNIHYSLYILSQGVAQGSELGPVPYLLYTRGIPTFNGNIVATLADDIVILTIGDNSESTERLQAAIAIKLSMKLNETKSLHIDSTNQSKEHKPV